MIYILHKIFLFKFYITISGGQFDDLLLGSFAGLMLEPLNQLLGSHSAIEIIVYYQSRGIFLNIVTGESRVDQKSGFGSPGLEWTGPNYLGYARST